MSAYALHQQADALRTLLQGFRVVDLSHTLEEGMPVWSTRPRYYHNLWYSIHLGDSATSCHLQMSEHTGTHVDAPGHFLPLDHPAHRWVNEVPVETWLGRAAVIPCGDVESQTAISASRVLDWEATHGVLGSGDMVLFDFAWAAKWATRPEDQEFMRSWPGLGIECAELLVSRGIKAVGVDTLSPDVYGSEGDPIHRTLLGHGVVIVENLYNLNALPLVCFLVALPLKIKDGTGSPIRAIALVSP